jgi:predicted transcriptional regulator
MGGNTGDEMVTVEDVVRRRTIDIGQLLVEAVDALMSINVRQVIVLDNSRVVGVVTRADLMPAVLEKLLQRQSARGKRQAARPRAWSCVRH